MAEEGWVNELARKTIKNNLLLIGVSESLMLKWTALMLGNKWQALDKCQAIEVLEMFIEKLASLYWNKHSY